MDANGIKYEVNKTYPNGVPIEFVKNDCTASQFSWMSEVWDGIVEKQKVRNLLTA